MDDAFRRPHRPPCCPRYLCVENVSVLNGEYWSLMMIDKPNKAEYPILTFFSIIVSQKYHFRRVTFSSN